MRIALGLSLLSLVATFGCKTAADSALRSADGAVAPSPTAALDKYLPMVLKFDFGDAGPGNGTITIEKSTPDRSHGGMHFSMTLHGSQGAYNTMGTYDKLGAGLRCPECYSLVDANGDGGIVVQLDMAHKSVLFLKVESDVASSASIVAVNQPTTGSSSGFDYQSQPGLADLVGHMDESVVYTGAVAAGGELGTLPASAIASSDSDHNYAILKVNSVYYRMAKAANQDRCAECVGTYVLESQGQTSSIISIKLLSRGSNDHRLQVLSYFDNGGSTFPAGAQGMPKLPTGGNSFPPGAVGLPKLPTTGN